MTADAANWPPFTKQPGRWDGDGDIWDGDQRSHRRHFEHSIPHQIAERPVPEPSKRTIVLRERALAALNSLGGSYLVKG